MVAIYPISMTFMKIVSFQLAISQKESEQRTKFFHFWITVLMIDSSVIPGD